MQWVLGLALLAFALAGCTTPGAEPGTPDGAFLQEPASSGEPAASAEPAPVFEVLAPAAELEEPEPGAAPASPAEEPGSEGPATAEPPSAEAPAPAPPPPSPRRLEAPLPELKVGDTWSYVGTNLTGARYDEVHRVVGLGEVAGVPVYVLNVTLNREPPRTVHLTRDGLNTVNATGFVTELLRFPLRIGGNWTFGWEQEVPVRGGGTVRQGVEAVVEVVAHEKVRATGTSYTAYRLHANVTSSVGSLTKWTSLEYWYAPRQKAVVHLEQHDQSGRASWSDLVLAQLG